MKNDSVSRRVALQYSAFWSAGTLAIGVASGQETDVRQPSSGSEPPKVEIPLRPVAPWKDQFDRVWLGESVWANPMESWRLVNEGAECITATDSRNVHSLIAQYRDPTEPMVMSVDIKRLATGKAGTGAGFRLGIRSDIDEYRANCFALSGLNVGVDAEGLLIGAHRQTADVPLNDGCRLTVVIEPLPSSDYRRVNIRLLVEDSEGEAVADASAEVPAERVIGNLAIVNNLTPPPGKAAGDRYRFSNWLAGGEGVNWDASRAFGPILWTMYTLNNTRTDAGWTMRLMAFTGPLADEDNLELVLEAQMIGERWQEMQTAPIDRRSHTAIFNIDTWPADREIPVRVVYHPRDRSGELESVYRKALIKANPTGRPLRLAALTCQNDYAFPYEPVARNIVALNPDLLYFSGDQLYENHGGYGVIRDDADQAILNYLRKFYQFGWSFGEAMRSVPTICLPDDHDVFQGNIWGEGGKAMDKNDTSSAGGYRQPPEMVNVVHRTNTGHHPLPADPTPVRQGISVYYGELIYGDVGFAIIADRQFKTGPEAVDTGSGRADHVLEADFDTAQLDKPGLVLLGERQEGFLKDWSADWRAHSMKVLLSQTVFAGVATHHGDYDGYLKADLDSGGWPQTARDRAIELLRPSQALHINGDQHLTSLVQYGVREQRDSNWSFCTPAIAVGYPRWWRADESNMPHSNRPKHGLPNTGEYLDGLGNRVFVYAVGNPIVPTAKNRYEKAHEKASGFGFVLIDTQAKTYEIHSYRFLIDPNEVNADNEFPGWPVTIHQAENAGNNRL